MLRYYDHSSDSFAPQFCSLSTYFDSTMEANRRRFTAETMPGMIDLALQLPQLCSQPLPLLRKQVGYFLSSGNTTIIVVMTALNSRQP